MIGTRGSTQGTHFSVPKRPDFLEDSCQLALTDESKQLFVQGNNGQGYIGIVEVDTGKIHLIPSFNKDDGLLRIDKNGKKFSRFMETEQPLGGGAGDLHTRSAAILKLGEKAGKNGLLMGFGIWKGGNGVKLLSEAPDNPLRLTPYEILLVKNKNNTWTLFYVDGRRRKDYMPMPQVLHEYLYKIPVDKKISELTTEERLTIEKIIHQECDSNLSDQSDRLIKFAKNRSSSQNMFSCIYTSAYGKYFADKITGPHQDAQEKMAHTVALQRELALPVFHKIMTEVYKAIGNQEFSVDELLYIVPNDKNDNYLRMHLNIDRDWIRASETYHNKKIAFTDDAAKELLARIDLPALAKAVMSLPDNMQGVKLTTDDIKGVVRAPKPNLNALGGLARLKVAGILTDTTAKLIVDDADVFSNLAYSLVDLANKNLLNDEMIKFISRKVYNNSILSGLLIIMVDLKIISPTNFSGMLKWLENNANYQGDLYSNIIFMHNKNIFSERIFSILKQHMEHLSSLTNGIVILSEANIMTDDRLKLLDENPQFAEQIANSLVVTISQFNQLKSVINTQLEEARPASDRMFAPANVNASSIKEAIERAEKNMSNKTFTEVLDWKETDKPSLRETLAALSIESALDKIKEIEYSGSLKRRG